MSDAALGTYVHRQRGWLWLACLLPGVLMVFVAFVAAETPSWMRGLFAVVSGLLLVLAACFVWLETRDAVDALHVRFGPLRSFSLTVPYADVVSARRAESAVIDGWGIHYVPGRGWTWNVQGRDCVEIELASGKRLRVGTDDPDGLLDVVQAGARLAARAAA